MSMCHKMVVCITSEFMIWVHTKLYMSSFSGSLLIAVSFKAKYTCHMIPIVLNNFCKSKSTIRSIPIVLSIQQKYDANQSYIFPALY
jgi:hypothetical protein